MNDNHLFKTVASQSFNKQWVQSFLNMFASRSFKKQWKRMLFQYCCFPKLQKWMTTNAFSIFWLRLAILRQGLDFQVLAAHPETINFKLKLIQNQWFLDPGAPGADFEDLTGNFWKLEKQWKPMFSQYLCFQKLQEDMKTNAFSIRFLPKASKSNERQRFFDNMFASQSFKKQWKPMLFQYVCFPKLPNRNDSHCFFNTFAFRSFKSQCFSYAFASQSFKKQRKPALSMFWLHLAILRRPIFLSFGRPSRNHRFQSNIKFKINDFGSRSSTNRFWRSDRPSPKAWKAMKTNVCSICLFPKASKSTENQRFFDTFASQSFKKR